MVSIETEISMMINPTEFDLKEVLDLILELEGRRERKLGRTKKV